MTDARYDIHMAHSSHISSALNSNKNNMQTLSAFNVKGFHAGRAHVYKTKEKKRKENGHP